MRHSLGVKKEITSLRKKGKSIKEIMSELSLPKTTVWHHIKDIQLAKEQLIEIRAKRGGSVIRKAKFIAEAKSEAKRLLCSNFREEALVLTMLYWAEGNKESCAFTNTDSKIVRLFLKHLRDLFKIGNDRISVTVRTFTGMNHGECVRHWSEVTGVEEEEIILHPNGLKSRGSSKYGVCRLTIRRGGYILKVLKELVEQYCSRSSMDRTRVS